MYIKHHIKICRWYLLVVILKIDIKYTFLVRFHIFSRNDSSPVNRPVDPKQIATEIINTPAFSL